MVHRIASHKVSSHQTRDLVCFADSSNIPWNPPTIFHPDQIATVPQMSLLSLYALLSQQSHLFPICVALTYNDSRIVLHRMCQILRICHYKWLLVSSSAPGTSLRSSGSPDKSLFCTGCIVTTELPNLVPQQRIDGYYVIHSLHWELCDPQLWNHQNFPLWVRLSQHVFCKKPLSFSSSSRNRNLDLSELLLATPLVIHDKNWMCLDPQATGLPVALLDFFHQQNSLWTPVASPASHAKDRSVLLRLLHF